MDGRTTRASSQGARPQDGAPGGVVRWGVLGGVWVDAGAGPVALSPQTRYLLATLLRSPGRPVSADALVRRPPTAAADGTANAVRVAVARARASLGQHGAGSAIVTTPVGYALDVEPSAVDHLVFEQVLRDAEATEWPADALRTLDAALALWRGRPFGELADEPQLRGAADALEERHREAVDRWCATAIEAGTATGLVARLDAAVAEEPFREQRWEALMLARYRAGSQRDAINTYEAARALFAEQLGVSPGPRLRTLLSRILDQDPGLEWRPGSCRLRPAGSNVLGLAPPVLGRETEIGDLLELLGRKRVVVLTGCAGIGKTALAVEVATMWRTSAWVVDLAGATGTRRVEEVTAEAMGVAGHAAAGADRIAQHLEDSAGLLVLDGCDDDAATVAQLVAELQAGMRFARVLATARSELDVPGAFTFALGPLATGTARAPGPAALIAADHALVRPSLIGARWPEIEQVCERADGVPLALQLLGAALANGQAAGSGPATTADAVTSAVESLPVEGRYAVAVLRALPCEVGVAFLGNLTTIGSGPVQRAIGPAVRAGIAVQRATTTSGSRVRLLHPVREALAPEPALTGVLVKDLYRTFRELAVAAAPSVIGPVDVGRCSALDDEHDLGLWLLDQLDDADQLDLACLLVPVWRSCGRHVDGQRALRRLEPVAARTAGIARAWYWVRRAQMCASLADRVPLVGELTSAMALAEEAGHADLAARAEAELAVGLGWSGQLDQAARVIAGLRDRIPAGNRWAAVVLDGLATMGRGVAGDPGGAAVDLLAQARELREVGHHGEVASSLYVAATFARLAEDEALLEEILGEAETIEVDRFSGYPMAGLAAERARLAASRRDPGAGPLLWEAYGLLQSHGEQRAGAICRRELGTWRLRQGDAGGVRDLAMAARWLLDADPRAAAVALARLADVADCDGARPVLAGSVKGLATSAAGVPLDASELAEVRPHLSVRGDPPARSRLAGVLAALAAEPA